MNKFLIISAMLLASSLSFAQSTIIEGTVAPGLRYDKNYIINSEAEKSLTAGIVSTMGITARTSATANVLSGNYSFELTSTNPGQTFTASSTALAGVNGQTCEGSFLYKFGSTTVPFYASVLSGSTTVASATLTNTTGSTSATIKHVMTFPCIEGVKPSMQLTSTASSALKLYVDKVLIAPGQPLVLPLESGGTNNGSLSAPAGAFLYLDGSKIVNTTPGVSGQVLASQGSFPPAWVSPSGGGASICDARSSTVSVNNLRITPTSNDASGYAWRGIAWGNGIFAVVGDTTGAMSSPDGMIWTARTIGVSALNVAYGNSTFVAVGTSGAAASSPDGITWTTRTTAVPANSLGGLTFGNGLFVAVGNSGIGNRVQTSPDGVSWTVRTSAADYSWSDVSYGNGLYVAVASSGGTTDRIMTSTDGVSWTLRTAPTTSAWNSVEYGNGMWAAVGNTGAIMSSPDGITWTSRSTGTLNWASLTYGGGIFFTLPSAGANYGLTSTDGITWYHTTEVNPSLGGGIFSTEMAYGAGVFLNPVTLGTSSKMGISSRCLPFQ